MDIQTFSLILMGIIILIICYNIIGNYFQHKHIHILHQTGVGILIGLIFGTLLFFFNSITSVDFNQEIFFYGLLPPMIFAGGYNLKKKDFGKNFKYILIYGLIGTITSFGIIFGLTVAINQLHWIIPLRSQNNIEHLQTTLMIKYSATISATDSVAALTLIKSSEFPKIFSIIFGEGMVNDAVAIILFKVVGGIFDKIDHDGGQTIGQTFKEILYSFVQTIFFSVLIGILSGLICSYLFRKFRFLTQSQVTEVVLTYLFGILSYVVAEYFDMSGVITILVSGVALAHYNFYNLTIGGMHATAVTFQSISFIAQAIVFVYLGITTIYYLTHEVISFTFLALQLFICILARFITIFGLSFIFKLIFKKKWTVNNKQLSIVSISGSIRGSVAFALILTIQENQHNSDQVSVIKSTTLMMVCITTIILGGLMPKFIKFFLGSPQRSEKIQQNQQKLIQNKQQDDLNNTKDKQLQTSPQNNKKSLGFFKYNDENYWRPFFIYNYKQRKSQIKKYKNIMKYNSRGEYEGGNFNALVMMNTRQSQIDDFINEVQRKDIEKTNLIDNHHASIKQVQQEQDDQ